MPLTEEQQALFDHARRSLPRWLTRGKTAVLEWLHAYTQLFDAARAQGQTWLDVTYIDNATGAELDQHALDRGTVRRANETDESLRARIRDISDMVTEPALKDGVDALLALEALSESAWVSLRRDRGHYQIPGDSTSFLSRGYRMSGGAGYIVILPYGTTETVGQAVEEYLRQYGPAGYLYIVEIRGVP